jgi:hypothetical protein
MAGCLAVLVLGQRRLGDQRPEPGLLGFADEGGELLVNHRELVPGLTEPVGRLGEPALELRT